jgi:hypothetical protein
VTNNDSSQDLSNALAGNTICVAKAGGWQNQEYHQASGPVGGNLIDYKKGPADPIDPTKAVGVWAISGSGVSTAVTYSYLGGGVGTYSVCSSNLHPGIGATIGFCPNNLSASVISATIQTGANACH